LYLKSIYINGFKSFANKIKLDINSKLTAVVGPNGSGKSNISDAFKWVLGEQSAKTLRGNTMSDVIFAGTQNKNPQGIAQVDLIFDNSDNLLPLDYNEVSITRKLYRSGESEYLINREKTQLKKIKELFMDTGIGIDGYSVISQGRIDEIISKNTETKRKVLEEAAGIVKFKARKEETEKKLEKTEDNLERINDIVSEIKKRIDPLKKQKQDAEKYLELKEELKSNEVNLLAQEYKKYQEYKTQIMNEKNKSDQEYVDLETKRNHFENKLEKDIEEVNKIDEKIIVEEKELNNIEKNLNDRRNDIKIEKEKLNIYEEKLTSISEELKNKDEKLLKLNNQKIETSEKIEENKNEIIALRNQLNNFKEKIDDLKLKLTNKDSYIKNSKGEIFRLYQELSEQKNNVNQIKNHIEYEEQKKQEIEDQIKELKLNTDNLKDENSNLHKNIKKLKSEENNIKNDIKEIKNDYSNEKNELLKVDEELTGIKENLNRYENLIKIKSKIKDSYEGFYRSIQEFMKFVNKGKFRDEIEGVLVELIKVKKEYREAVDTALGSSAQNIIIKEEKNAQEIIRFLKNNRIGRMTFLPMNTIKSRTLNYNQKKAQEIEGYIDTADNLVKCEDKYSDIISNILGKTIVCKNIKSGTNIAKRINYSTNIVTLDGDIIYAGGAITGGSKKRNNNLLGRAEEIEKLIIKKKSTINQIDLIKDRRGVLLENIKKIEKNLENKINNLKEKTNNREKLDFKLENISKELKDKEIEYKSLNQKKQKTIQKIEENKKVLNEKRDKYEKINQTIENYESDIKNSDDSFEEEKKEEIKITNIINETKVNLSKKVNEQSILKTRLNEIMENIEEINSQIIKLQNEKEENKNNIKSSENKIIEYKKAIKDETVKINERNSVYRNLKEERKNLQKAIYENQSLVNTTNKEINNIQKDINSIEIKIERYENKIINSKEKLWNDYEMNFAIAKNYINEELSINALNKRTKELKNLIKKLGDINIGAIEEYDENIKRYDFLNSQREDLIEAKEKLNKIIIELTNKMHDIFLIEYEKINEAFKEVFIDLFSGGDAEIILSDRENPLDCDIEIYAQPPGKNLNKISLLSGGEKALTAISLLFSILKVKPTPFCILDEIEAALDDSNVYRFANYLRKFSERTQFLIITHRKGTMEFVDTIYGTTMEEEGVTKIVSMNLSELIEKEYVNE